MNTPASHAFSYHSCNFCPRRCGIDRSRQPGYCGGPDHIVAARAALHDWEEPCISGFRGSGTVFFSGCTLRCCFCQNYRISSGRFGAPVTEERLAEIFLTLQSQGAHNINLVTATQYLPSVLAALRAVRQRLVIPVVYNCGGYETEEAIDALSPYIDVWLPDLKYFDPAPAARYSGAPDYFQAASLAVKRMIRAAGPPVLETVSEGGRSARLLKRGVLIRHLVLPGQKQDSIRLMRWIHDELPKDSFLISLMSQYTPYNKNPLYPELNRRITSYEYNTVLNTAIDLGLTQGYMQKKSSAKEEYTPPFGLEGIVK